MSEFSERDQYDSAAWWLMVEKAMTAPLVQGSGGSRVAKWLCRRAEQSSGRWAVVQSGSHGACRMLSLFSSSQGTKVETSLCKLGQISPTWAFSQQPRSQSSPCLGHRQREISFQLFWLPRNSPNLENIPLTYAWCSWEHTQTSPGTNTVTCWYL